jgi:glycoprotein-N-acetylgalactosamine 3-beta-galactosyltransferase
MKNFQEILSLLIGFMCGFLIFQMLTIRSSEFIFTQNERKIFIESLNHDFEIDKNSANLYEEKIANKLFNEVKILCWVFTHPDNHKKKVPAVRATWGRRCNKLLFMSIESDPHQPDIIALPIANGRDHLWNKTKLAMQYVHDNYIKDYDWFMRADDDK